MAKLEFTPELIERFIKGDRRALAQALSAAESQVSLKKTDALTFLKTLSPRNKTTMRIAVSGPPGVGKSTFINAFTKSLLKAGYTVGIIPIDPASEISSGSILADKTRMHDLLNDMRVYIRPFSSRGALGGLTPAAYDCMLILEAFGFDAIIFETVGVGQSESLAYSLCDHFLILLEPGAGDELQAMKKGLLERADYLLVNKCDESYLDLAERTFSRLRAEFKNRDLEVLKISSLSEEGIAKLCASIIKKHELSLKDASLHKIRSERLQLFVDFAFRSLLIDCFMQSDEAKKLSRNLEKLSADPREALLGHIMTVCQDLVSRLQK